jgi:Co/Zn/Cd efflux system component
MSGGASLNEREVSWHLLEDVLGWAAVLIIAIVLKFKDIHYLDPALSLFITAYILWGGGQAVEGDAVHIFAGRTGGNRPGSD